MIEVLLGMAFTFGVLLLIILYLTKEKKVLKEIRKEAKPSMPVNCGCNGRIHYQVEITLSCDSERQFICGLQKPVVQMNSFSCGYCHTQFFSRDGNCPNCGAPKQ